MRRVPPGRVAYSSKVTATTSAGPSRPGGAPAETQQTLPFSYPRKRRWPKSAKKHIWITWRRGINGLLRALAGRFAMRGEVSRCGSSDTAFPIFAAGRVGHPVPAIAPNCSQSKWKGAAAACCEQYRSRRGGLVVFARARTHKGWRPGRFAIQRCVEDPRHVFAHCRAAPSAPRAGRSRNPPTRLTLLEAQE